MKWILKKILKIIPDKEYLKIKYFYIFHKRLNLHNPVTFSEKIQWLKLYDRKDVYTMMVDKYEAKKYVSNIIGENYIIPTLGVYDKFDDIEFDKLPDQFVIKCTHDSGGLVIVNDKKQFNYNVTKNKINKSLKQNYYWFGREWPYKNIKPMIIIEKYMEDKVDKELRDYKFFCFNGKFEMMFIASNRQGVGETYFDFFDKNLVHLSIVNGHPNAPTIPHMPKNIDLMIYLAEKISGDIPQIRIDFYEIDGRVYFGEMTLFHWSGFVPFEPEEWDEKLGDLIKINNK